MDIKTESREQTFSPQEQIRRFVTRVWEHPLVDEKLRQHRELAKTKLDKMLREFGVDPSTYITIPVGSLIWAVDEKSDFDYQLVLKTTSDLDHLMDVLKTKEAEMVVVLTREKINLVYYPRSIEDYLASADTYADFLFTPDDYIGGNQEMAREIRLTAVKNMISLRFTKKQWKKIIGQRFDIFFRKWDDLSNPLSLRYKRHKINTIKDRSVRIQERLKIRAQQTHNPEKYKVAFERARSELRFPDFQTYAQAIIDTQGALSISPRHVAIGIKG